MHGMRIKSHKNAFGTHNGDIHKQHWNPNAPKAFWQGLHPVAPAVPVAKAAAATKGTAEHNKPTKSKRTAKAKSRSRK